jgi:hypothetical protein
MLMSAEAFPKEVDHAVMGGSYLDMQMCCITGQLLHTLSLSFPVAYRILSMCIFTQTNPCSRQQQQKVFVLSLLTCLAIIHNIANKCILANHKNGISTCLKQQPQHPT